MVAWNSTGEFIANIFKRAGPNLSSQSIIARSLSPFIDFRPAHLNSNPLKLLWASVYLIFIMIVWKLLFLKPEYIVDMPVLVPLERLEEDKAPPATKKQD